MGSLLCESVFCEIPGWYRDSDLERVLRINGSKPSSHQEISYLLSRMSSSAWFSSPKTSRATKTSAVTFTLRSLVRTLRRRLDFPFSRAAPRALARSRLPAVSLASSQTVIAPHMRGDDVMGSFWVYYYFFIPAPRGRTLCIIPNDFFLKPRDLVINDAQKMKMTMLYLSPSILESCLLHCTPQEFSEGMQEVHTILLTGERVRRETRILFAERLTPSIPRLIGVYSL